MDIVPSESVSAFYGVDTVFGTSNVSPQLEQVIEEDEEAEKREMEDIERRLNSISLSEGESQQMTSRIATLYKKLTGENYDDKTKTMLQSESGQGMTSGGMQSPLNDLQSIQEDLRKEGKEADSFKAADQVQSEKNQEVRKSQTAVSDGIKEEKD